MFSGGQLGGATVQRQQLLRPYPQFQNITRNLATYGNTEIIIDGGGKTLAPGFIDTHSHHDYDIPKSPDMIAVTNQGVTTIIIGQDGSSQWPLAEFYAKLENSPVAVNIGSYSGQNTLREKGMDAARRAATDEEIARMSKLLEADMAAGAFGLSTGLIYETGNFSTSAEVMALAQVWFLPPAGRQI